jgi:hypothetical protein
VANKRSSNSYDWVFWIVLILSLAVCGIGLYLAVDRSQWAMLAAGCASTAAVLIAWALAAQVRAFHSDTSARAEQTMTTLNERFEQFSVMLNLISEQQLLSDRAKAVAFREKDSDALRRAIQDEINNHNWEAASSLADEMEEFFGYRQEAARLRAQIDQRRGELVQRQVNEAIVVIDRHVRNETWSEAMTEAHRIAKALPESAQAVGLPAEIEKRREAHKQQLIASLRDAAARHDSEGGMEILKRLDTYLTPVEAEQFQELARNIMKEKMAVLRTQFSVAVQDHKWADALRLADSIMADFPNTQMAKEVRDMLDSLRARAAGKEPAPAPAAEAAAT